MNYFTRMSLIVVINYNHTYHFVFIFYNNIIDHLMVRNSWTLKIFDKIKNTL